MSSTDSPAPVTPRKNVRDLKTPSVLGTYNTGIDSYNSLSAELKSVRTDMAEKLEPLGEKVDRILEVTEQVVDFVNVNYKRLEMVLDQAADGVSSGPVSIIDVGVALKDIIHDEANTTSWHINRVAAETRWFTAQCTMVVLLFIVAHFVLNYVHSLWTPVCAMAPPVPPVCAPCRDTALPSMWDNYMSCARIFTKDTY